MYASANQDQKRVLDPVELKVFMGRGCGCWAPNSWSSLVSTEHSQQMSHPYSPSCVNYVTADVIKKRFSSYAENGIQKRPRDSLTFSPQTGQRRIATRPKLR